MSAGPVDWTQVLLAAITTVGSIVSGLFAFLSRRHERSARRSRQKAAESADIAVSASLRPRE